MKILKFIIISIITLVILIATGLFVVLKLSLADLDGDIATQYLQSSATLERDDIGTAVITANNQTDAAYILGYAHAQDRFFQMDLLRRSASGRISELFGDNALNFDKKVRFNQLQKRADTVYDQLSNNEKLLLKQYSAGVNESLSALTVSPFEYLLTSTAPLPWKPTDSLLVIFSMYADLQNGQISRDLTLSRVEHHFGKAMLDFLTLPSPFQAALDGSIIPIQTPEIPVLESLNSQEISYLSFVETDEIGSNNWAVTGALTNTQSAMLSNDMHLGLRVPAIWYRAQLNYSHLGNNIKVTGVSLPGAPAIIVGSNQHIAWGFTNANFDNVDWIKLLPDTPVKAVVEIISTPEKQHSETFQISQYGPVREIAGTRYALSWVGHKVYSMNLHVTELAHQTDVNSAIEVAQDIAIPLQNLVVVDEQGNAAWRPTGAITSRPVPSKSAIEESEYSPLWEYAETQVPAVINPESGRIWTANARVTSAEHHQRFGDGGYALGARSLQIKHRLQDKEQFTEKDFYAIQLDNEARFLMPWHTLLYRTLQQNPDAYKQDLHHLENWKSCACADSIGYTLVRRFRSSVINQLVFPIDVKLKDDGLSISPILRSVEPAIWALLNTRSDDWLPQQYNNYDDLLIGSYQQTKAQLIQQFDANKETLAGLEWGNVNQLNIKHPISNNVGILGRLLDMKKVQGFGDSYMPAVQSPSFGASQRFIIQPGFEHKAILTIPGGQSGHPLSPYFRTGFSDYAEHKNTPLLPQTTQHTIYFQTAAN